MKIHGNYEMTKIVEQFEAETSLCQQIYFNNTKMDPKHSRYLEMDLTLHKVSDFFKIFLVFKDSG